MCLLLAAVAVALLPTIVAKTALRDVVLSAAMPSDRVRVSIKEASLSWLSPPALSAIEVKDAAGATLLTIESARADRSLWSFLFNRYDFGVIEIVRPALHVELRANGSNIEDIARELFPRRGDDPATPAADHTASPKTRVTVRVVEGNIIVNDSIAGRFWNIQGIDVQYDSHATIGNVGQFALSGQLVEMAQRGAAAAGQANIGQPAGRFAISLTPGEGGRQQLSWQVDSLSMALVQPWLRRAIGRAEISGALAGRGTATWTANATVPFPTDFASSGAMQIEQLDVAAPLLAGDRLRLQRVELPWRFTSQPVGIVLEDFQLRSDFGQLAARGVIDSKSISASLASEAAALDAVARHDVEIRGALDLKKLAAMFPRALRIRDNTTITSGSLEISARHEPRHGGQILSGALRTANLAATSSGRALRWDEPLSATFALQRNNGAMRVDALTCESDFLEINASGTPQQFAAAATFDLNRLVSQLGQFVDLRGIELAGTGEAELKWNQADAGSFSTKASGQLAQLRIALPGGKAWAEPQLEIEAEASGAIDAITRQPTRIDRGSVSLDAQGDELDARLTAPVDLVASPPVWTISLNAKGAVDHWLTRARPWFRTEVLINSGQGDLVATFRVADRLLDFKDTHLVLTNLQLTAPGWNIHEPRVELVGDARWDGSTGRLAASNAQFVTSTVSLAVQDVRYRPPQIVDGAQSIGELNGVAAFRADLSRLSAWRSTSGEPPEYESKGAITGKVRFEQRADGIRGEVTALGENLALAQISRARGRAGSQVGSQFGSQAGFQTVWQEPRARFHGLANYDVASDSLALDQCQIQSNTLQANVAGQIEHVFTTTDVNLNGTVDYDLAQITPLLKPYLGEGVQLEGREQGRFAVVGQLGNASGEHHSITSDAVSDPYRVVSSTEPSPGPSLQGRGELPHWSRRLRGQLEMPWSGASVYGMPVGGGKIVAALSDGAIRVEPISVAVGEGRLTAAPAVRLDPPPAEVTMPPGPVITNVRISPEVSEAMLKYVAPVLAGTTQSEGLFSMQLDGMRVPLGESEKADAAGRLTVHSVRVVPGPLANQWIGLAQQIEAIAKRRDAAALAQRPPMTLLAIRDQGVNFRVLDGRVHHEQMEFSVDDVVLRSQGSVGFDETLSLLVHVPIQDRWVEREKLLVALKGQTLTIPIAGTLSRPQMDQRAVVSLSQQLLQGAAQQAIGGELNKALEKLFKAK